MEVALNQDLGRSVISFILLKCGQQNSTWWQSWGTIALSALGFIVSIVVAVINWFAVAAARESAKAGNTTVKEMKAEYTRREEVERPKLIIKDIFPASQKMGMKSGILEYLDTIVLKIYNSNKHQIKMLEFCCLIFDVEKNIVAHEIGNKISKYANDEFIWIVTKTDRMIYDIGSFSAVFIYEAIDEHDRKSVGARIVFVHTDASDSAGKTRIDSYYEEKVINEFLEKSKAFMLEHPVDVNGEPWNPEI